MDKKVLAIVDGKEITQEMFDFAVSKFPAERKSYLSSEEGQKQLLDQIISWELVYDFAKDEGYEKREDYIFQLEEAKKAILTQIVIQEMMQKIQITEEEIREYYDQNRSYFAGEEQISARHVLVDSYDRANEVISAINSGMSFEEAAQLYSSCPSKAQGGDLGFFGKGMMVPEFEEAAFSLAIGKISEPVKTQFGYHVILVENKKEPEEKPFEEVKEMIRSHILQEKQNYIYMQFVNELKEKYKVEIK